MPAERVEVMIGTLTLHFQTNYRDLLIPQNYEVCLEFATQ